MAKKKDLVLEEHKIIKTIERVYLGDWLFNAGIVGFLNIISEGKNIDEIKDITIGENYIEFDRKILTGFSQKYFETAFNQYGRYKRLKTLFNQLINKIDKLEVQNKESEELLKDYHKKSKDNTVFSLMKSKLEEHKISIPSINEVKKDKNLLIDFLKKLLEIMTNNYQDFFESDVQIYLRNIYGQKSFLNLSVNKDRFNKFKTEFEDPLLNNSNKEAKKTICICCSERQSKSNVNFDTGLSPFYGVNSDAKNFFWNFDTRLPLCEICELIYFCYFASFTDIGGKKFYFVNNDSSIEEIYKNNQLLKQELDKNLKEKILINFFSQLILEREEQKAEFSLENISFIEMDFSLEILPKVFSFNVSKIKAKFFTDNRNLFEKLEKANYQGKDLYKNILIESIDLILENKLTYNYLYRLSKILTNPKELKPYFNSYHLQELNILIFNFIQKVVLGRNEMSIENNELWVAYNKGLDFAENLRMLESENKLASISYKLLNSLRIGDVNSYLDVIMRFHIAYSKEVSSIFTKALSNKDNFYPIGYSFVNGLLGKKYTKEGKGSENNG
ncbi:MAG: type I-B CRISPR-associated protein Cas8b1/Cst1 [Candidatus Sericytochromatia bacterium]